MLQSGPMRWNARARSAAPAEKSATLDQYIGVRVSADQKALILEAAEAQARSHGGGIKATMVIRQWLEDGVRKGLKARKGA